MADETPDIKLSESQAEVLRRKYQEVVDTARLRADLAEALALLAESALDPEQLSRCTGPDCCWDSRANALLVRHGIRESEPDPGSTLLAWGLHEVDPDDWLQP